MARAESENAGERPSEERLPAVAGPLLLMVAFCALAAWSWGKWTDVQIDFGNELYIPWQITEGKALYRDIAHRNGPLPHYLNAVWFGLFGVSLRTLVWCNLAILAAIVAMTWKIFANSCGRLTATFTCGVLLGVFAFSQYAPISNYNYVTPYHHHQTHGIALTLAMMLAIGRGLRGRRTVAWLGAAGAALGGVFLTKAELFVPAAMAAAVGVAGVLPLAASPGRAFAAFLGGAAAPVGLAFAGLAAQMPTGVALQGVLGNWSHLFGGTGTGVLSDPFYRRGAGLDAPGDNLVEMAYACIDLAAFVLVAALIDRDVRVARRPAVALGAAVLLAGALHAFVDGPGWASLARTLPLVAAVGAGLLVHRCWQRRRDAAFLARWGGLALWSVWALGMLAKLGLKPRIHQYGFALAMPAALLLVAGLVHGLPRFAAERWKGGGFLRAVAAAGVIAAVWGFWSVSDQRYRIKQWPVGSGADRIWVEKPPQSLRGGRTLRALTYLEEHMAPADTLLVMPEGIILNYWLQKRNPTRFDLFLPTELDAFGREAVRSDVEAHPPDWIALVDRGNAEFGVGPFGEDPANGRELVAWVKKNYEMVHQVGSTPFTGDRFGIQIWRRDAHSSR